jgi:hypothetical protein
MEIKEISYALSGIYTDQFALIDEVFTQGKEVKYNLSFHFGAVKSENIVGVRSRLTFEQDQAPFIILDAGCNFKIAPNSWDSLKNSESEIVLPRNFAINICSIVLGAVRGILHSKLDQTAFSQYMLPLIIVQDIVKEDVDIDEPVS